MIVLFTDFGLTGPYVGEMKAVLEQRAPDVPVIDLMHDAPPFDPKASAYLLAALAGSFPAGSIFVCVVDPGVGSDRAPVILEADGQRFVGPDNGLLAILARRAETLRAHRIAWRGEHLSASFHGRDLFSPVAAMLATNEPFAREEIRPDAIDRDGWPDELAEVVYIDSFGNAMTGIRAITVPADAVLQAAGRFFPRACTFSDVAPGDAFWYENSSGLAEIAVNCGRADGLGLVRGAPITISET
jgi:S-adenosyl-L-methionine hydrolase (adenosine-forming)